MKNIFYSAILFITTLSFGQMMGGEEITNKNLTPWITNTTNEYKGVFSLGTSEAESEFTISVANDMVCAQLKSGDWDMKDGKVLGWKYNYKNYTNVKIKGNKFFSDQSNGEFVIATLGNEKVKCLKLNQPPIQTGLKGSYELGLFHPGELSDVYGGDHIETKFNLLTETELRSMTSNELKIMRNEIFARYGYKFKKGGKMDTYFSKQEWYSAKYDNVDQFLTRIEKANIKAILKIENN